MPSPSRTTNPPATARPAFASVVETHGASVYRFLVAVAGANRAEDCWQETFLAALEAYPQLKQPATVRSWLFTIAHRKAVDAARDSRRAVPVADVPDSAHDPQTPGDGLWRLVAELPPKQRAAVAHRFIADLAYRDIGAAMGTSEQAARRNVLEALRALRATAHKRGANLRD